MPKIKPKTLRAIQPNAGTAVWYHRQLDELLQASYLDAINMLSEIYTEPVPVGIAMDAQITYLTGYTSGLIGDDGNFIEGTTRYIEGHWQIANDAAPSVTKVQRALKKWGDKWRGRFDKLSVTTAQKFAGRSFASTENALKSALRDAGFTISFKPTRKSIESYRLVVADNVGLIRNLQESFYNKIQQDVWSSVRAGADMHTLSRKLQKSYGIENKRAALIARDQNAKAKAVLETTRRQELGIRQAIWQHSSAGKEPRPLHVQWGREAKVFDLSKGMWDEDEGEYVFPGQLINCRCTSRAIIPGLEK